MAFSVVDTQGRLKISDFNPLDLRKAADETVVDATIQADNELTVSLAATTGYYFRFTLFFSNGGIGEGFQVDLSGTVGVTALKAEVSIYDDTLNSLAAFARVTALGSAVGAGISSGSNYALIEGTIKTSTAGTFFLRWAQNAVGAGAGVTVQAGSGLVMHILNT